MYVGNFDILWWDDSGVMPDPQQRAIAYYHSSQVPSQANPTGFNMSRIADPEIDAWLEAAGSTPDPTVRQENYCKVANKIMKEMILEQHNGAMPYVGVANSRIQDWDVNELYAPMGWDIANWWIKE
jgi:ABC-type transport system substrate-binding protein